MHALTAVALALALLLAGARGSGGADAMVTLVVPFSPGGAADLTARPLAVALARALGAPVNVVNRPGGAGTAATHEVAGAPADGRTLLVALPSFLAFPESERLYGRTAAYRVEDFTPLGVVTADPAILVVRAGSAWTTVGALVGDARRRPGELAYGSAGVYTVPHLVMALLEHAAGVRLRHVPYNGVAPALTALLGGQVDALACAPAPVLSDLERGTLRALAVSGAARLGAVPRVPTFAEAGYPAVEVYVWAGLFAPARTPAPVVGRLRDALRAAVADRDFVAAMARLRTPIVFREGAALDAFLAADARRLGDGIRGMGRIVPVR